MIFRPRDTVTANRTLATPPITIRSPRSSRAMTDFSVDSRIDAFEAAWQNGGVPAIESFLSGCPATAYVELVSELVAVDLERRWAASSPGTPKSLRQYLDDFQIPLTEDVVEPLLESEYRARHLFGDAVSRQHFCQLHADLPGDPLACIERTAESISWPTAAVRLGGRILFEKQIDRTLTAGRQDHPSRGPWTTEESSFEIRITLCPSSDPSLSRHQIQIEPRPEGRVALTNTSRNRALALTNKEVIEPGSTNLLKPPFMIHLGADRFLRIRPR